MSDKNRDTSRPTTKVIKNPLLSSGITGLTFNDIAQNAILFPPAAPIIDTTSTGMFFLTFCHLKFVSVFQCFDIEIIGIDNVIEIIFKYDMSVQKLTVAIFILNINTIQYD